MNSSNNPRFRLLVGWCCLMTSALLILSVYVGTRPQNKSKSITEKDKTNLTANQQINTKPDQLIGSQYGPSFNDYIRLIRDNEKTWIHDSKESSSLSLNNGTVEIKTDGLYHIHAQVIFNGGNRQTKNPATVVLVKNKRTNRQDRKLSEVMRFEPGTLTMIRLVDLAKGDSISLNIKPESLRLSNEACHTYWEILLYNKL
ncbi:lymphotoxin-alpha isoform X1 [Pseudorasbora parva]|uniref:lymphotoxin-alpha isoform X1 n=1 Tax=Pseudorasbora parva TaxID=51549 RepID=UPI00351F30CC